MKCVDALQLLRGHAGQLSAEQTASLEGHVAGCAECAALRDEVDGMTRRFAPDPGEFDDPAFTGDVMALIRSGRAEREFGRPEHRPRWWARKAWLAGAASAAAAALLMITWPLAHDSAPGPGEGDPGVRDPGMRDPGGAFQARGGSAGALDRWVSLRVYRRSGQRYEQVGRQLRAGDALAMAYLNRAPGSFKYLMVFAVDHRGRTFWYYPAHDEAKERERVSIAIKVNTRPTALPEQVRHDWAPGRLELFGLFSKTPLAVKQIERLVARQLARAKTIERLELEGVAQHRLLFDVAAPSKARGASR